MKLKRHRNKDVSIRMSEEQYNDLMTLLTDCDNIDLTLKILLDELLDEEVVE